MSFDNSYNRKANSRQRNFDMAENKNNSSIKLLSLKITTPMTLHIEITDIEADSKFEALYSVQQVFNQELINSMTDENALVFKNHKINILDFEIDWTSSELKQGSTYSVFGEIRMVKDVIEQINSQCFRGLELRTDAKVLVNLQDEPFTLKVNDYKLNLN